MYRFARIHCKMGGFLIGVAFLLAGCGLFGSDGPQEAKLTLSGMPGAQIELIVSNNFVSSVQPIFDPITGFVIRDTVLVQTLTAETTLVALPFERTYNIEDNQQFFALISRLSPDADELFAQLFVDGNIRSEQRPNQADSSFTIIYNFGNRFPEREDVEI